MSRTLTILAHPKLLAAGSAVALLFQKYVFDDWDFVVFLMLFVVLDTLTGTFAAWKNNKVNSTKMGAFGIKILVYSSVLVVAHGLTKFPIHGTVNKFFVHFFDAAAYTGLMAREALSIFENLAAIDPKLVPKRLRKKLEQIVDGEDDLPEATQPEAAPEQAAENQTPTPNP